jgi:hypothetical protein
VHPVIRVRKEKVKAETITLLLKVILELIASIVLAEYLMMKVSNIYVKVNIMVVASEK